MTDAEIQELVTTAKRHFRAGDLEAATEAMSRVVAAAPQVAAYQNDLGVVYAARREPHRAEISYRQAIALSPQFAAPYLNLGNALRDQGRWTEAAEAYRQAATLDPSFPDAHHALGTALRAVGRLDEAVQSYQRALTLRPRSPQVHNDLGGAMIRLGRTDEAIRCFQTAIELDPNYPHPYRNLGPLLLQLGRAREAAEVLARLVHLDPASAKARYELGTALARSDRPADAVEQLRQAVALDANLGSAWCNLGLALEDLGKMQESAAALAEARRLMPQSAAVAFHYAAIGAGDPPTQCPPEYLLELFDDYANRFDEHLFNRLAYRGPQLLFDAVGALEHPPLMDIADLGCGTGAAGPLFRSMAKKLVAVDVSPRMLDKARERGAYDELVRAPIADFLRSRPAEFGLLLAADVFIYIGDLREVFEAAAGSLRAGGLFAFTIETIDSGDYLLRPTRRYAQSLGYIQRLAGDFGFKSVSICPAVIRAGEGPAVQGAVVVLRRALA